MATTVAGLGSGAPGVWPKKLFTTSTWAITWFSPLLMSMVVSMCLK